MTDIHRRTLLAAGLAAAGAAAVGAVVPGFAQESTVQTLKKGENKVKRYPNEFYYDKDGKFLVEKAKQAYFEMMEALNCPIYDQLKTDEFWALDFGLGDFANVGMGGIFWLNVEKYSYFGHEIYLLPGQMIPEHRHITTTYPCKMESWQVRYGSAFNWSEGEPTVPAIAQIPDSQKGICHCKHCEFLKVGSVRHLEVPESWHFLMGGPDGAVVTEYARYHDGAGVKFANPKAQM